VVAVALLHSQVQLAVQAALALSFSAF